MTEKKAKRKEASGISRSTLRIIGLVLAGLGILGRGLIENRVLGVWMYSADELLNTLNQSGGMTAATTALVLEGIESCAVPIFGALLIDGFMNTRSFRNYLLRVTGLAVVCELPYNFAISGKLIDAGSRNPVFGLIIALVMLYFFHDSDGTGAKNVLTKVVAFAAALLWAGMFRVKFAGMLVIIVAVLWIFRTRRSLCLLAAAAASVCCSVVNPLYMFAPFGFLAVYFYNGELGKDHKVLQYAVYPVLLILVALVGTLLF